MKTNTNILQHKQTKQNNAPVYEGDNTPVLRGDVTSVFEGGGDNVVSRSGFKRKYPRGYHGTVAILEQWFKERCSMSKKERDELAFSYGKRRKQPKRFVSEKTVQCSKLHYLVDYTALSFVPLDLKKNRYLWNLEGYHRIGFIAAKNILENRKYVLFVEATQLKGKDIKKLKMLLENELGYKTKLVTDNQHELTDIAEKEVTMWIEVEFGGIKTKLYKLIRSKQKTVRVKTLDFGISKGTHIYTDVTIQEAKRLYEERFQKCGVKLLNPRDFENYVKRVNGGK